LINLVIKLNIKKKM